MDNNIFKFIWRHSKRDQIIIIAVTVVSFFPLYYSLDLPKIIVNEAIDGQIDFPTSLFGVSLGQIEYLLLLSFAFLGLVCVNGGLKYWINVYRGQVGERMLRRLRYELYTRVLRFRLPRFKKMSQGEIIPMITAEVEPMGGFVGDALALPAFQGGTLLVYVTFIFIQDWILGLAAVSLYPLQAYVIPKLQRHVNQLGKQRVRTVRRLSDRIGETVGGAQEIHAHDTSALHQSETTDLLGRIYTIRYEIFRRKFFIKFLNNFLNQLTPFFFYSIGGYLVITGSLSFGALVAVLAAYKDLSGPWRELLNYYQRFEDIRIKYEQVVEQFQPADIMAIETLEQDQTLSGALPATLQLSSVGFAEDDSAPVLDGLSLSLPTDAHLAILGLGGGGKDELMLLLGRLYVPTSGRMRLGEHDYVELAEAVTGRRMVYVGPQTFMVTDSLRNNLYYGLKHRPAAPAATPDPEQLAQLEAAIQAGNSAHVFAADWIDYGAAGVADAAGLEARAIEVLAEVALAGDVYRMGLTGTIDPLASADLADRIMAARRTLSERLGEADYRELVEQFDPNQYNESASVAENLLFGTPIGDAFDLENLGDNAYVQQVLRDTGLAETFVEVGVKVAETMIELFADLPPGHHFFDQFSFISSEDLPDFQPMVQRFGKEGLAGLKEEERSRLTSLPFKLIPARHRLGIVKGPLIEQLLAARRRFAEGLPEELRGAVAFFDPETYNPAATLLDNMLFGKVRSRLSGSESKVQSLVGQVVADLDLRNRIIAVGLDYSVGVAGARLDQIQRQKLALARALIKRPDLLILNEALSALDAATHKRLHGRIREMQAGKGLWIAPHRPELAEGYEEIIVIENGQVAGRGDYATLAEQGGALARLLSG